MKDWSSIEHVYTYILEMKNGRHYTGITNSIARRLMEHRKGHSKSTKDHRPVRIIYLNMCDNRKEARELEVKIKRAGARRFLKTYIHGNLGQLTIKPLNENLEEMMNTKGDEQ